MVDERPKNSKLVILKFRSLLTVILILAIVSGSALILIRGERNALSNCELAHLWYVTFEEPKNDGVSFDEFLDLQFRSGGIVGRRGLISGPRYSIAMADLEDNTFKVLDLYVSLSGEINSIERISISRSGWNLHSALTC